MVLYSLQESKLQAAEAVKSEILFDFFIFPFFLKKRRISISGHIVNLLEYNFGSHYTFITLNFHFKFSPLSPELKYISQVLIVMDFYVLIMDLFAQCFRIV